LEKLSDLLPTAGLFDPGFCFFFWGKKGFFYGDCREFFPGFVPAGRLGLEVLGLWGRCWEGFCEGFGGVGEFEGLQDLGLFSY
jgi:hypothetical protein